MQKIQSMKEVLMNTEDWNNPETVEFHTENSVCRRRWRIIGNRLKEKGMKRYFMTRIFM